MVYELIVPEWSCVIPPDWKLEFRLAALVGDSGAWRPAASVMTLHAGDELRGNGGPEEEYLGEMVKHEYVKELTAGE